MYERPRSRRGTNIYDQRLSARAHETRVLVLYRALEDGLLALALSLQSSGELGILGRRLLLSFSQPRCVRGRSPYRGARDCRLHDGGSYRRGPRDRETAQRLRHVRLGSLSGACGGADGRGRRRGRGDAAAAPGALTAAFCAALAFWMTLCSMVNWIACEAGRVRR